MSLPSQTFSQVTPMVFQKLAASLEADYGLKISGFKGSLMHAGFQLDYDYTPETQVLILTCVKKPFLIPASTVQHGIVEHVSAAMTPSVI